MNRKQFAVCRIVIASIVGAVVGYSVYTQNFILPVGAVVAGILILHMLRRIVDEVMEDERIYRISEKAARASLQVFGISTALIGTTLILLGKYSDIGYTLNMSVCALIVLYVIFYAIYSRKAID